MPVYNEAETVAEYLQLIDAEIKSRLGISPHFYVTDDCSTDNTLIQLRSLQSKIRLCIIQGEANRGSGPSTVASILRALEDEPQAVVICDSDGQFSPSDIGRLIWELDSKGPGTVVRAKRVGRKEKKYRMIGTGVATLLTSCFSRSWSPDSNCPLRGFYRTDLVKLMPYIPNDHIVPAIGLTIACQRLGLKTKFIPVLWHPRSGSQQIGTLWTASTSIGSAVRYLRFCLRATYYLFQASMK